LPSRCTKPRTASWRTSWVMTRLRGLGG
jgi:hypothetical protein